MVYLSISSLEGYFCKESSNPRSSDGAKILISGTTLVLRLLYTEKLANLYNFFFIILFCEKFEFNLYSLDGTSINFFRKMFLGMASSCRS